MGSKRVTDHLPDIGHCKGELQFIGTVRCHSDLNGSRPLGHHTLQPHLEQFIGAQGTTSKHHSVVEVLRGTKEEKLFN